MLLLHWDGVGKYNAIWQLVTLCQQLNIQLHKYSSSKFDNVTLLFLRSQNAHRLIYYSIFQWHCILYMLSLNGRPFTAVATAVPTLRGKIWTHVNLANPVSRLQKAIAKISSEMKGE